MCEPGPFNAGIIVVTMVLIVCLSFSGYLVNNIPVYFKWIGKLSYFSYAYAALVRHMAQRSAEGPSPAVMIVRAMA